MKKITAENVEDDSVVASCNCRTKSPEIKFHKPGCKYRLITERDEAWTEVQVLTKENTALRALVVKHECPYGHRLPDGICSLGYPGCACADDVACHEDETIRRVIEEKKALQADVQKLREALQSAKGIITHTFYKFPEWQQAQDTLTQINAALQPKAGEKGEK